LRTGIDPQGPQNVKIRQNLNIDFFHDDNTFPIGKVKTSHRELSVDMIILTEVFCNARKVRASLAAVLTATAAAEIKWLGEGERERRGTQH